MYREIEGSLDFSWEETLRGLNIGNRAPYRPQNSLSQSNDILFEDVLSSEILPDGSLFTRKLIQKPLGMIECSRLIRNKKNRLCSISRAFHRSFWNQSSNDDKCH